MIVTITTINGETYKVKWNEEQIEDCKILMQTAGTVDAVNTNTHWFSIINTKYIIALSWKEEH